MAAIARFLLYLVCIGVSALSELRLLYKMILVFALTGVIRAFLDFLNSIINMVGVIFSLTGALRSWVSGIISMVRVLIGALSKKKKKNGAINSEGSKEDAVSLENMEIMENLSCSFHALLHKHGMKNI
jgi:hypothetical protein